MEPERKPTVEAYMGLDVRIVKFMILGSGNLSVVGFKTKVSTV